MSGAFEFQFENDLSSSGVIMQNRLNFPPHVSGNVTFQLSLKEGTESENLQIALCVNSWASIALNNIEEACHPKSLLVFSFNHNSRHSPFQNVSVVGGINYVATSIVAGTTNSTTLFVRVTGEDCGRLQVGYPCQSKYCVIHSVVLWVLFYLFIYFFLFYFILFYLFILGE